MRSVRTVCATCGTVEVAIEDARLVVAAQSSPALSAVEFRCPRCGADGRQEVGERGVRLLTGAGIEVVALAGPAELAPTADEPGAGGTRS